MKVFDRFRTRASHSRGRALTLDSRICARDAVVTTPTKAQWSEYFASRAKTNLGEVWSGVRKRIADLPPSQQADAERAARDAFEEGFAADEDFSSGGMGPGPFNSTATRGRPPESTLRANPNPIEQMQKANDSFWAARQERPLTPTAQARDNRFAPNGRVTVGDIAAANKSFWDAMPGPAVIGRPYGKG